MSNHGKNGASQLVLDKSIPDIADMARKSAAQGSVGDALDKLNNTPTITPDEIGNPVMLGDLVLIQPKQPAARSEGGIMLPDSAQGRPCEGVVIACGPGQYTQSGVLAPMALRPGDKVRFLEEQFNMRLIRGKLLLLMREVDVVCVFPPETV